MSHGGHARRTAIWTAAAALAGVGGAALGADPPLHDVVIRHAMIYDGSGAAPYAGELAIDGDRIAYVGAQPTGKGRLEVDARGEAVAPGFIDMMGHSEESLLVDGRGVSGLKQGVTLDIFTEGSMGPLTPEMAKLMKARQGDVKYDVTWSTLGQYLEQLEQHGISPNVASFVGEGEVRVNVLGEGDVQPTAAQLEEMRALVHQAMEQGRSGSPLR